MNSDTIPIQIEFPSLKKMIKINFNPRSSLKQYLPLFGAKFDTDFSVFQVIANLKMNKEKKRIPVDIPIRSALEGFKENNVVI